LIYGLRLPRLHMERRCHGTFVGSAKPFVGLRARNSGAVLPHIRKGCCSLRFSQFELLLTPRPFPYPPCGAKQCCGPGAAPNYGGCTKNVQRKYYEGRSRKDGWRKRSRLDGTCAPNLPHRFGTPVCDACHLAMTKLIAGTIAGSSYSVPQNSIWIP
jgi:hypothetical protein